GRRGPWPMSLAASWSSFRTSRACARREAERHARVTELGVGADARYVGAECVALGLYDFELCRRAARVAQARDLGGVLARRCFHARCLALVDRGAHLLPPDEHGVARVAARAIPARVGGRASLVLRADLHDGRRV